MLWHGRSQRKQNPIELTPPCPQPLRNPYVCHNNLHEKENEYMLDLLYIRFAHLHAMYVRSYAAPTCTHTSYQYARVLYGMIASPPPHDRRGRAYYCPSHQIRATH
jgi:hypothetical protein